MLYLFNPAPTSTARAFQCARIATAVCFVSHFRSFLSFLLLCLCSLWQIFTSHLHQIGAARRFRLQRLRSRQLSRIPTCCTQLTVHLGAHSLCV